MHIGDERLSDLFGSAFKNFGELGPGIQVVYAMTSKRLPIGYIGDPSTPADAARLVIDCELGTEFGPIRHIALGHEEHGKIVVATNIAAELDKQDGLFPSITSDCDGIIVKRRDAPMVVETMLGDCGLVVIWDDYYAGFLHVGRPELFAGAIEKFMAQWRMLTNGYAPSGVWMGPCIGGDYYELPNIPDDLARFATETIWFSQGFDLRAAILDRLDREGIPTERVITANIDPFAVNEAGDHSCIASDRWYRFKGEMEKLPLLRSPRNTAMLFISS